MRKYKVMYTDMGYAAFMKDEGMHFGNRFLCGIPR